MFASVRIEARLNRGGSGGGGSREEDLWKRRETERDKRGDRPTDRKVCRVSLRRVWVCIE